MMIPAMVPTYINQMLDGSTLSWPWVIEKLIKAKDKLGRIQKISEEVNSWIIPETIPQLTKNFIHSIPTFIPVHQKRLVLQATSNSFFELDLNPTHIPI